MSILCGLHLIWCEIEDFLLQFYTYGVNGPDNNVHDIISFIYYVVQLSHPFTEY